MHGVLNMCIRILSTQHLLGTFLATKPADLYCTKNEQHPRTVALRKLANYLSEIFSPGICNNINRVILKNRTLASLAASF